MRIKYLDREKEQNSLSKSTNTKYLEREKEQNKNSKINDYQ